MLYVNEDSFSHEQITLRNSMLLSSTARMNYYKNSHTDKKRKTYTARCFSLGGSVQTGGWQNVQPVQWKLAPASASRAAMAMEEDRLPGCRVGSSVLGELPGTTPMSPGYRRVQSQASGTMAQGSHQHWEGPWGQCRKHRPPRFDAQSGSQDIVPMLEGDRSRTCRFCPASPPSVSLLPSLSGVDPSRSPPGGGMSVGHRCSGLQSQPVQAGPELLSLVPVQGRASSSSGAV